MPAAGTPDDCQRRETDDVGASRLTAEISLSHGTAISRQFRAERLGPQLRHDDHRRTRSLRQDGQSRRRRDRAHPRRRCATPASRRSIPRTSIRSAAPRRSSARRSKAVATTSCSSPRRFMRMVPAARHRPLAQISARGVRRQPAPAADRLPRSLSLPRAGHARAGGRDAARVRGLVPPARSATSAAPITRPGR